MLNQETENHSVSDKKYLVPFILITSLFFLWGFARAILDVLNKHFQNALHISITQSALIQVTTYLGYFLMAIPAGIFINKYGYRRGVVFGLLLFGLGAIFFIPGALIGSFSAFLFCLFVIGCGLVFLETAANPYVTELGARETATSRLNLSQSFNGLGSIFANHRMFVFGLFALLSYEVAEISINSYFINFVTGMHWMSDRTASLVLTLALAFFMVGRFLGSWIMRHIQATTMLLICAVGSVACIGLVLCDLGIVSLVALVGNYLFEAIMFPTIFSIALTGLGNLTKSASSLLMMTPIGGCGFLLMGMIADTTHVTLPFVVPFIGFLIVLAYAVREYKLQSVISK